MAQHLPRPRRAMMAGMDKSKGTPELKVPDALGDEGRAAMGAQALLQLQQQRQDVRITQVANGSKDDDLVPAAQGGFLTTPEGDLVTYKARREQIMASERAVVDAHGDIYGEFTEAVRVLRKSQQAQQAPS